MPACGRFAIWRRAFQLRLDIFLAWSVKSGQGMAVSNVASRKQNGEISFSATPILCRYLCIPDKFRSFYWDALRRWWMPSRCEFGLEYHAFLDGEANECLNHRRTKDHVILLWSLQTQHELFRPCHASDGQVEGKHSPCRSSTRWRDGIRKVTSSLVHQSTHCALRQTLRRTTVQNIVL